MAARKIADLAEFNTLGMGEFELTKFASLNNSLLVTAHRGEPENFYAELSFTWVGYISCPVYFFDVRLRLATEQEIALIGPHKNASTLYCFEDILAAGNEKAASFFISANSVEITAHYGSENLGELINHAQQAE